MQCHAADSGLHIANLKNQKHDICDFVSAHITTTQHQKHDLLKHFYISALETFFVRERVEQCLKTSNIPRVMFHAILKLKQAFDFYIVL